MASITIRNLDDQVKEQLRIAAAHNGHSMEEEARLILGRALATVDRAGRELGSRIRNRPVCAVELTRIGPYGRRKQLAAGFLRLIVLDTNVLSEFMRVEPDAQVLAWVDAQPAMELAIAAITVAEILHGLARLPSGQAQTKA